MPSPSSPPGAGVRRFVSADLRGHPPGESPRPLVLVADDHASVAKAVGKWFRGDVLAPVTSLSFLTRVAPRVAPLVLVADLDFGGTLALDVLQELVESHPALAVVAYSGHDDAVMRAMVRAAGVKRFVAKLDDLELLVAAVAEATAELASAEPGYHLTTASPSGGRRQRKRHNAGPPIRWALASGFKRSAIARVVGVAIQTVDHHAKALRSGAVQQHGH